MQLTKDFKSEDFACKCGCGFATVLPDFAEKMQKLQDILPFKVEINSGCRCQKHNDAVGGEKDSQHVKGNAADIRVKDGALAYVVQAAAYTVGFKGIALKRKSGQEGIVHVDDRPTTAVTWSY